MIARHNLRNLLIELVNTFLTANSQPLGHTLLVNNHNQPVHVVVIRKLK